MLILNIVCNAIHDMFNKMFTPMIEFIFASRADTEWCVRKMMDQISPQKTEAKFCQKINTNLMGIYTVSQKKQDTKLLPITSPNVNRFSKFFHW